MKKIFCYYHNDDLDGVTSATVVKKKHDNVKLFGWNYGEPINGVQDYDIVYIVDLTLPENIMKELIRMNKKLIWIDHHGRKIKDMENSIGLHIDGLRDTENEHSACVLAWKYLFPEQDTPSLLRCVEDLDLWKFNYKNTDCLTTALWITHGKKPELYINLLDETTWNAELVNNISKGNLFIMQREEIVSDILTKAQISLFRGYKTAFINSSTFQSFVGNKALQKIKDISIALIWNVEREGFVRCSLRSKNVDVSKIAKELGGGGHPQASGFQTTLKEFMEYLD